MKKETIKSDSKENVLVYGMGNFYFKYKNIINERYNIKAFIDRRDIKTEKGEKTISPDKIIEFTYDKIVIMVQNIQECINISKNLIAQGISYEYLILGHTLCGHFSPYVDNIKILSNGNLFLTVRNISVEIQSEDEFNNTFEILVNQLYHYYVNNSKQDIVIDVGMNIGDATLYFLDKPQVRKVYGWEPFMQTYLIAKKNLCKYLDESERVEIFQYGISNENAKRVIRFNTDMSCGQSTIEHTRENAYELYLTMGLVLPEKEEEEEIEVRRASEIFLPIIKKYPDCNIILKMNCEGEEYSIIHDLAKEGLLDKFTFIMLEWHYKGKNSVTQYLREAGFSYWCYDKSNDIGLIYAYNNES